MNKSALISVSDKSKVDELAQALVAAGYDIISTGGTAKYLTDKGIPIIQMNDWTGFPEIMNGRVKTLHPKVHGGILADRENKNHLEVMISQEIKPIDVVIVNLYPFEETLSDPTSTEEEIIENIDIGGPTLIRSAAKNFKYVAVLTEKDDYQLFINQIKETGKTTIELRKHLAARAFAHVAHYDEVIRNYFDRSAAPQEFQSDDKPILEQIEIKAPIVQSMRYGENPHQQAGYFSNSTGGWTQLHGKPLSYNNMLDLDAALRTIMLFEQTTAIICKHTNPCGIGSGETLYEAYEKAFQTDPLSPFGGIIIVNRVLDIQSVAKINEIFTEIIIAPDFNPDALELLKKRKDRRLVQYDISRLISQKPRFEIKTVLSGYLVQDWDTAITSEENWKIVTVQQPTPDQMEALRFAWRTVSILKSNAIALTTKDKTVGLGIGQTSRIDSTEIAIGKALHFGHALTEAVCASDGFFPFRDSIEMLNKHEIRAVIQPGGSKGDDEVIAACNEYGICMIFTGMRHFKH